MEQVQNQKKHNPRPSSSVLKTPSKENKKRGKMINENALFLEPREEYDQCIIGVDEKSGRIIYSVEKILDAIVHNSMLYFAEHPEENRETIDHDDLYLEASEHYYEIIESDLGEHEPIYLRYFIFFINENALFLEPREEYDQCIMGVDEKSGRIIYSVEKILDTIVDGLMLYYAEHPEESRETIDHDDLYERAIDDYHYNIIGSDLGEHEPIYLRDPVFIEDE